jgi:hypothetical protein
MPLPAFLLPLVSSVAPALVRLATGSDRAADVAREVSDAVGEVVGIRPETPELARDALEAIQADPALYARLRSRLAEIEQEELECLLADRQDARSRDLRVRELAGGVNTRANVMLLLAFLAIIAIAAALVLLNLNADAQSPQQMQFNGAIIGFLTGIGGMFARNIGSAFDFEFGSSRGSKNKDGQIEALTQRLRKSGPGATPSASAADALAAFRARMSD